MKTWLTIIIISLAPIGATGAFVYKIAAGQIKDPIFYLLCVILPASLLATLRELKSITPPDRIGVEVRKGIRGKRWVQASNWDTRRTRELTSLYIPIRLENNDLDRAITLYDVLVFDRLREVQLNSPMKTSSLVGKEEKWLFTACDRACEEIFNDDKTEVKSASIVDTYILLQEEGHLDNYDLKIQFKDNYGRKYSINCSVVVSNVAANDNDNLTTEWAT